MIKMRDDIKDNIDYIKDKELLETRLKDIEGYINVTLEDSNGEITLSPSDMITLAECFICSVEGGHSTCKLKYLNPD